MRRLLAASSSGGSYGDDVTDDSMLGESRDEVAQSQRGFLDGIANYGVCHAVL